MADKKIKVLVAEDSLVAQKLLKGLLSNDDRFELVALANNGQEAVEFVEKFKPDVVSMDIHMPLMDGVDATRAIMQQCPVPIIICSSFYQPSEVEMAIKVLEAGAVSILSRPYGPGHPQYFETANQYLNMLKTMSEVKVVRRRPHLQKRESVTHEPITPIRSDFKAESGNYKILAIGASAGGPEGIKTILSNLPDNFPLPILIVQHIDSHFADGFCNWLNTFSKLPVHIAKNGDKMLPGHVYLPPGDHHMEVRAKGIITISNEAPLRGIRPSIDVLFQSVGNVYGKEAIAVVLSGMGKDGATQLKVLRNMGAYTFAQEESSCLVFGMPGEAVRLEAAISILSPTDITTKITMMLR